MGIFDYANNPEIMSQILGMTEGFAQASQPTRMPIPWATALGMGAAGAMRGKLAGFPAYEQQRLTNQGLRTKNTAENIALQDDLDQYNAWRKYRGQGPVSAEDFQNVRASGQQQPQPAQTGAPPQPARSPGFYGPTGGTPNVTVNEPGASPGMPHLLPNSFFSQDVQLPPQQDQAQMSPGGAPAPQQQAQTPQAPGGGAFPGLPLSQDQAALIGRKAATANYAKYLEPRQLGDELWGMGPDGKFTKFAGADPKYTEHFDQKGNIYGYGNDGSIKRPPEQLRQPIDPDKPFYLGQNGESVPNVPVQDYNKELASRRSNANRMIGRGNVVDPSGRPLGFGFSGPDGKLMVTGPDGVDVQAPPGSRIAPQGMGQAMTPDQYLKLKTVVMVDKQGLDRMARYFASVKGSDVGIRRWADQIAINAKTLFGSGKASPEEINRQVSLGQLQGLLGLFRVDVVGPGVMTEYDAERVIQALGGDVTGLQNPQVVQQLLAQMYQYKKERLDLNSQELARQAPYFGQEGATVDLSGVAPDLGSANPPPIPGTPPVGAPPPPKAPAAAAAPPKQPPTFNYGPDGRRIK